LVNGNLTREFLKKFLEVGFWAENGGKNKKKFENPVVTTIDKKIGMVEYTAI